jgi:hypothetical protein
MHLERNLRLSNFRSRKFNKISDVVSGCLNLKEGFSAAITHPSPICQSSFLISAFHLHQGHTTEDSETETRP